MEIDIAQEIEITRQELRVNWALDWQSKVLTDNSQVPPEPPWHTYKEPELVGIRWETGFAVITAEAFRRLSRSQLSKLTGGKPYEKRNHVRGR